MGKSTLVADLARALPGYMVMVEPFVSLVEEGHSFADPPTVEDFEAQLERSIEMLGDAGADVLFERCPVDFLAYIAAHEDGGTFDPGAWLPRVRAAVSTLDLIAYAPLQAGRRRGFRARVDDHLREILVEDAHGLGLNAVEVAGEPGARVAVLLAHIRGAGG